MRVYTVAIHHNSRMDTTPGRLHVVPRALPFAVQRFCVGETVAEAPPLPSGF